MTGAYITPSREHGAHERHAPGRFLHGRHVDVEGIAVHRPAALDPADQPADLRRDSTGPTRLAVEHGAVGLVEAGDVAHDRLRALRQRKLLLRQTRRETRLLDRADLERPVQPETVDHASDLPVAVAEPLQHRLHAIRTDAAGDLLVNRHVGDADRVAHAHVAFPLFHELLAAPIGQDLVLVLHRTGLERDQAVGDLEGRGGNHARLRPRAIDDGHAIRGNVEQHERTRRALLGEQGIEIGTLDDGLGARRADRGEKEQDNDSRHAEGSGHDVSKEMICQR
jgi:hypothetical protein